MKKGNGISPIVAILLTAIVAVLTVLLYKGGHPIWGTIFALITVDFLADAFISCTAKS